MKNTLIALTITAELLSVAPLYAMEWDDIYNDASPEIALGFVAKPTEEDPKDDSMPESLRKFISKNPFIIHGIPSPSTGIPFRRTPQGDPRTFSFDVVGSPLPKSIHDLHAHFHDKAMTREDLHLFVFDLDDSSTSTITTSSSHDLGQEKHVETVRAAIEKDMQEDDEPRMEYLHPFYAWLFKQIKKEDLKVDSTSFPIIITKSIDWKRAQEFIERLDKSPAQMPKIEEVD